MRRTIVTITLLAALAICLAIITVGGAVLVMIVVNWHYFTSKAGI